MTLTLSEPDEQSLSCVRLLMQPERVAASTYYEKKVMTQQERPHVNLQHIAHIGV